MSTQDVVAMWEQRVRQEGLEKGLEKGLQQGLEKGREEVALATHRALLRMYELRFGPPPEVVRERVSRMSDPEVLTRWTELIGDAPKEQVDQELTSA